MVYHVPTPRKNAIETMEHFRQRRYAAIKKAIKNLCQDTRIARVEGATLADATQIRNEMVQLSNIIITATNDAPTARLRNRLTAWGNLLTNDFNDIDAYRDQLLQQQVVINIA